ncbi:MAG: UDP-N-acetylmuramoyl-L-alanine--D-glutamate ligase [Acidobacteriota bacterium]
MADSTGIVGFGKTGKAVLDFLMQKENQGRILVYDDKKTGRDHIPEKYLKRGVEFLSGADGFRKLADVKELVISPGVNGKEKRFDLLREKGVRIKSEMEFAVEVSSSKNIIAVTGTNGKSTTVSLIHHFLKEGGKDCILAGNIGTPLTSELSRINKDSIIVLEVSSFQLEEIIKFKPAISVILNVTPDHLDRYSNIDDYYESKLNIIKNQNENDFVILNRSDRFLSDRFKSETTNKVKKLWFAPGGIDITEGGYIEDNTAVIKVSGKTSGISLENNPLIGTHNLENILVAVIVGILSGISPGSIERSLGTFKGLEHRMEKAGELMGVTFINDSKATNIDATVKSISGVTDDMALILGGKDKGGDFSVINKYIDKKVKRVILLGEAADKIRSQLDVPDERFIPVESLEEAVRKGFGLFGGSGGVVLLAPGCASFDMFQNFEVRGQVFKKAVKELIKEYSNG